MKTLRRLSLAALVLAFAQIVFGAIVRITGSGWGCGEHWPKCDGQWIPPLSRPDLIIEVTHRYIALALTLTLVGLAIAAFRKRGEAGVGGRGGVLRAVALAALVVVVVAIFGAITIKLRLNPFVIVTHLALAMTLLAALVAAVLRAGGLGARAVEGAPVTRRTANGTKWAAVLAFVVVVFGGLTANLGAAAACLGFPLCSQYMDPRGGLAHLQLTHRALAFLLFFHVFGVAMAARKRKESPVITRAAWIAFGVIVVQILVAASLVELRLPKELQSLHQAVGTLVWLAVFTLAALARRGAAGEPARLGEGEPAPSAGRVTLRESATTAASARASASAPVAAPASDPLASGVLATLAAPVSVSAPAAPSFPALADAARATPEPAADDEAELEARLEAEELAVLERVESERASLAAAAPAREQEIEARVEAHVEPAVQPLDGAAAGAIADAPAEPEALVTTPEDAADTGDAVEIVAELAAGIEAAVASATEASAVEPSPVTEAVVAPESEPELVAERVAERVAGAGDAEAAEPEALEPEALEVEALEVEAPADAELDEELDEEELEARRFPDWEPEAREPVVDEEELEDEEVESELELIQAAVERELARAEAPVVERALAEAEAAEEPLAVAGAGNVQDSASDVTAAPAQASAAEGPPPVPASAVPSLVLDATRRPHSMAVIIARGADF